MKKKKSKIELFLELAKPDEQGFSREVFVSEFKGQHKSLKMGNGGSWFRDDSSLGQKCNIERGKKGNRIDCVRLHGFNKKQVINKAMAESIHKQIRLQRCVVLGDNKF